MFKHNKATFLGFTKHQIHTRQIPQPSANSGFIGVICFKRQFQRRHASEMDANLEKTKTKKCRLFSSEGLPVKMCSRGFHQFHFRPFSNFVLRTSLCLFPCHAGTNRQKEYQTLKKDPLWTEKFRVFNNSNNNNNINNNNNGDMSWTFSFLGSWKGMEYGGSRYWIVWVWHP